MNRSPTSAPGRLRAPRSAVAFYRALLPLYPYAFRRRYSGEMVRAFAELATEVRGSTGRLGLLALLVRVVVDTFRSAWRERREPRSAVSGQPRARRSPLPRASRPTPGSPRSPRRGTPMSDLLHDLRHSYRRLLRSPGFTAVAALTLALGVGANVAIFSVLNAVLLRPLPFREPERLVVVGHAEGDGSAGNVGYATWEDWRQSASSFGELALMRGWPVPIGGGERAEMIDAVRVSANYFRMLGVEPALGRDFRPEDDTPETRRVVILSDGLWRRRFAADPGVIGTALEVAGSEFVIVGVMPRAFQPLISGRFHERAEMWAPVGYEAAQSHACRDCRHLKAFGRLRAGISLQAARAELRAVQERLLAEYPTGYADAEVAVVPLHDVLVRPSRPALVLLAAAVGLVLLTACANTAGLLVARAFDRGDELAVRSALGATRWRLARLALTETAVLSALGGAVGWLVASWATPVLVTLAPAEVPRLDQVALDGGTLGFALLAVASAGIGLGVVPALRGPFEEFHAASGGSRTTRAGAGLRSALVAGQIALAFVLAIGAGLALRSIGRLLAVDPGFEAARVAVARIAVLAPGYDEATEVLAYYDRLLERVRVLPGVEEASISGQIPLGGNYDTWGFHIESRPAENPTDDPSVERYSVTPAYFEVMGIPLLRGRLFTADDRADTPEVLLVGETTARRLWPDANPIGDRVKIGGIDGPWRVVVGVVGDVRHYALAEPPTLQMYVPQQQLTDWYSVLQVRTSLPPETLLEPLLRVTGAVDPDVPVYDAQPLSRLTATSTARHRYATLLLNVFAAIAMTLAAVGAYGMASYAVVRRTRELGIRRALGATARDIVVDVLRRGAAEAILGLGLGLLAALALGRWLEAILFEIDAADPLSLGLAATVVGGVATLAQLLPARQALRVDPLLSLRDE